MAARTRFLKWVGMPPVLQADGWRVHNWKYENTRPFPIVMPEGRGETRRVMEKGTYRDSEGHAVTLSREYRWDQKSNLFVTEVSFTDAVAIMAITPYEFIDVSDIPRETWPTVRNTPIIVPARRSA